MIHNRLAPYAALLFTVFCWGLSFIAIKIALESFTPSTLLFIRFSLASILFSVWLFLRGFPNFTKQDFLYIFLASLFQPGLYFLCETTGLQHTSASKASLIIATIPIVVLWLSALFLKERPTLTAIIGAGLSLIGMTLLIFNTQQGFQAKQDSLLGDLLILGAVFSMALYTVIMKRLTLRHSALDITALQMFYGALLFAPAFLWNLPQQRWLGINIHAIIALGCLLIFATIGAFLCYNYALAKLSAPKTAIFLNCVPVVTAIGAWAILHERLTIVQLAGGTLVLLSVYLTNINLPVFLASCKNFLLKGFERRNTHETCNINKPT